MLVMLRMTLTMAGSTACWSLLQLLLQQVDIGAEIVAPKLAAACFISEGIDLTRLSACVRELPFPSMTLAMLSITSSTFAFVVEHPRVRYGASYT